MNKLPTLRFRAFTRSWNQKTLGSITTFKSGNTPSKDNTKFWGGDIPWISASSMYGHYFGDSTNKITAEALSVAKKADKGSILLLVRGSMLFNKIPVGIATRDVTFNQDVKSINVLNHTSNEFLLLWFLAQENRLLNMVTGTGIGAGKLDTDELQSLPFVYPTDKAEQQKITDFLTSVDIKINQITERHNLLKEYKKGVMQQIFSQKIRFKGKDGEDFLKWEDKKLKDIACFFKGKGISKSDITLDGKYPCIRYGELYTHYNEVISSIASATNIPNSELVLSIENDVILPSSGETQLDIATAACVQVSGVAYSGDITIVRCNVSVNGVYLSYYLNSAKKKDIAALSQGSSVIHLYATHLKELDIQLPCLEEQQKVAQFLQSLDKKIDAVAKQVEQTKQFKKGLLQQMFV